MAILLRTGGKVLIVTPQDRLDKNIAPDLEEALADHDLPHSSYTTFNVRHAQ
ncbi:MAG: hypothetical protein EWM72_01147 [Nitrospira sp.]|nr:MAG: hypothetical protein EWM72_01147 [Nitrospira sp.]